MWKVLSAFRLCTTLTGIRFRSQSSIRHAVMADAIAMLTEVAIGKSWSETPGGPGGRRVSMGYGQRDIPD